MKVQLAAFTPTPAGKPWRDLCQSRTLAYGHCPACGRAHFYPRPHCPHCHATGTALTASAGLGVVYSYTAVQAKPAPYVLAYVQLDEGFTMLTQLGGDPPPQGWAVGQRVVLNWATGPDEQLQPVFRQKSQ